MIGEAISHYEVLEKLGEGGMGAVYLAKDSRLGRRVALKVLTEEMASDPDRLARFKREAKVVAALNHPNIVTVHSIEQDGEICFITMELVQGKVLERLIPSGGFALETFFDVAIPLADALAVAHGKGITHRDLKPANVMVTDEDRLLKILDFGLAKFSSPSVGSDQTIAALTATAGLTREGAIIGTVPYMSPEQVTGKALDHRTDIFSLGVILYEMLTGDRPFQGESAADLTSAILRDAPRPVTEGRAGLPRQLERIVSHCLQKEPKARFQTARDVCNELETLREEVESGVSQASGPVSDVPTPESPETHAATSRRGKWLWPSLAAVAVLLAVLVVIFGRSAQAPEPEGASTPEAESMSATAPGPEHNSIAVLAFEDMSQNKDQEYFSDGIAEELLNLLAKLPELRVISRSSAFSFKGQKVEIPEIARRLNVSHVLEGSVRKAGNQVRITAQLIEAGSDTHLWSKTYDRTSLENIFAVQDEIAADVVRQLRIKLLAGLPKVQEVDPEAYDAYLKGWYFWNKLSPEGLEQSLEHFRRSIQLAPHYAPAHASLAAVYHMQASSDWVPDREAYPLAKAAALKALELDDRLADAHGSLGFIAFLYDWDWPAAERAFHRALELNPSSAGSHHMYGLYLRAMGRFEEAVNEMERAVELDPLSPLGKGNFGGALVRAGRYQEAMGELRDLLELEPNFFGAHKWLGHLLWLTGKRQEAVREFETAMELAPSPSNVALLGFYYASSGRREDAIRILEQLTEEQLSPGEYVPPVQVAAIRGALGDHDRAFALLEEAYRHRDDDLVRLKVDPMFDSLRSDPRFKDLLRRMNFPH